MVLSFVCQTRICSGGCLAPVSWIQAGNGCCTTQIRFVGLLLLLLPTKETPISLGLPLCGLFSEEAVEGIPEIKNNRAFIDSLQVRQGASIINTCMTRTV